MATRSYKVGFIVTDTPGDLKTATSIPSTAAFYMTFEYPSGTDYQVTSGKTFHCGRLIGSCQNANGNIQIGYGDNGVADGAAAPTTPVIIFLKLEFSATAFTPFTQDLYFSVPATKYPYCKAGAAA